MKSNILIVGLDSNFNRELGYELSLATSLYFLDVEDYILYSLQDPDKMLSQCGVEYLTKQENSVVRSCADFENTIIYIPFEYYNRNNAYNLFIETCNIFYIKFTEENIQNLEERDFEVINSIAYEDYDKILSKTSTYVIDANDKTMEEVRDLVLAKLGE